jgi:hypothetical protein
MPRTFRFVTPLSVLLALAALGAGACGDDTSGTGGGNTTCSPTEHTGCPDGSTCEEVDGGKPACFAPVLVEGRVFDLVSDAGIEGALVVARDENGAALSTVTASGADGKYSLPVPAKRDASGKPLSRQLTLRADAAGYLGFPKPPRVALPLDLADATADGSGGAGGGAGTGYVLVNPISDIGLVPLADTTGLGSVTGQVVSDLPGGTLVIAGGSTGVADLEGDFTIFNVAAGSQTVSGYKQGYNLSTADVAVTAGKDSSGVVLQQTSVATATVTGSVQIVNGGGASETSVILVLEDTFDETLARGEAPPGLRAYPVTGAFSIEGVPDGLYVVLAAFENDGLVRDPDTSIGGTEIQHITVAGGNVSIADGFKVTGALAVVSPGANDIELVSGTPTFSWEDDSSEDEYHVQVFDALGNQTWETTGNFDPGGSAPASVMYGGPALEAGMIYQFRATSIKGGTPISSTEDLKGVFQYQ